MRGGNLQLIKTQINIIIYSKLQSRGDYMKNNNYKPKEFAELINISVRTVQRWDVEGKLKLQQIEDITLMNNIQNIKEYIKNK